MSFRRVSYLILFLSLAPTVGRADHALFLSAVAPLLVGADPDARPKTKDSDGSITREAYDAFLAGIASKAGQLSKKSAEDGDFYNKVKASMREVRDTHRTQPYRVKCVERVTHRKSTFHKNEQGVPYTTETIEPGEELHQFEMSFFQAGKGKFSVLSSRKAESIEWLVEKLTDKHPLAEGSTEFANLSKSFYLTSEAPTTFLAEYNGTIFKYYPDLIHFKVRPLTADGDVSFELNKTDGGKIGRNEKGEQVNVERYTEITCR